MSPCNDITDFLLKEYENVAKAFFNSYEIAAKWVRYYLIILAFPFSFVAIIYSNNGKDFDLFNLPNGIAVLLCLIGLLSFLISYIIVDLKFDSVLYARTVNGIRKYFVDHSNDMNEKGSGISKYILLPTDINKPPFFKYHGDVFFLILFMSIINSFYFSFGLVQIKQIKELILCNSLQYLLFIVAFFLFFFIHFIVIKRAAKKKETDYCKGIK